MREVRFTREDAENAGWVDSNAILRWKPYNSNTAGAASIGPGWVGEKGHGRQVCGSVGSVSEDCSYRVFVEVIGVRDRKRETCMDAEGGFDIGGGPGAMSVRARSFILPQSKRLVTYRTMSSFSIALRMSAWDVAADCPPRAMDR